MVTGIFFTRKFPPAQKQHKYAILVAARNESAVIANLINSIHSQDYPSELIDIFVVADNCDDDTAEIARNCGAICYERFDNDHRTKGFALQFLVECIRKDYGIESFDGYFIFDADNLLKKDYVTRMNESFDAGEKIITSYRNTKNFDDNWIAASYGIHWLRTIRFEHRARSVFRLSTRIQGTGFLFAAELIKDGWNYTGFTEDRAFSADAVANGYSISYNNEAEFFDEQPTSLKIALRQRLRWAKGHLQAVTETGPKLFLHIFVTKTANHADNKKKEKSTLLKVLGNIWYRLRSFDMFSVVFPSALITFIRKILVFILESVLIILSVSYFSTDLAPSFLQTIFKYFDINIATESIKAALLLFTLFTLAKILSTYFTGCLKAAFVYIIEHKRMMKIKWYKKIWFCLTFPLFDFIGKVSSFVALFKKVEWKPIPHTSDVTIDDIDKKINND